MARIASLRRAPRALQLGYDGRLQGVVNGRAIGWAWDRDNPERRLEIAIEVDQEVVADGVADGFRDELVAAEIGDGAHGFLLDLPAALQARSHVRLVALAGPTAFRLPRSPSFWYSATPGGPWSGVAFSDGRGGEQKPSGDAPIEVPPPPVSTPLQALLGGDGWLFDAADRDGLLEPEEATLDRVAGELVRIAGFCASLGVAYVPALVPDKLQAVSEGSPPELETGPLWPAGLRTRLRDVDEVEILDLLSVLSDARSHGPCFQRGDPSWNDRGAFFVARALVKEAAKRAPALRPLPLSRLHLRERSGYRGPLADAPIARSDGTPFRFDPGVEQAVEVDIAQLGAKRMPVERHLVSDDVHVRLYAGPSGAPSPRLSLVGHEPCLTLLPWLAEIAGRTTFFWAADPPLEPIELELPDGLLHLIGHRDLALLGASQATAP